MEKSYHPNSTHQPSWEGDSRYTWLEFIRPKVHYYIHNIPHLPLTLTQINPVNIHDQSYVF